MAERRMFKKSIIRSAGFMQLSRAAVQLYLYLCLEADDDGFLENASAVTRICKCSRKHLQELIDGGWVILFESGVAAITHWHRHNQIKKDRYRPTDCRAEWAMLEKKPSGEYARVDPKCLQNGSKLDPQERIAQESVGQISINQGNIEEVIPAGSSSEPLGAAYDDSEIEYDRILRLYQVNCQNLEPCQVLTPRLKEKIQACYQVGHKLPTLAFVFVKANACDFLTGKNRRGWVAGLEWLLEPLHIEAVQNGKYDNWV